jgi:Spy/CpxP family protein refolding chaperone
MKSLSSLKPVGLLAFALLIATPAASFADDTAAPPANPGRERPPVREPRVPPEGGRGKAAPDGEAKARRGEGRPGQGVAMGRAGGFLGWVAQVKELTLADDQKTKVDAIIKEFETSQREWNEKNGEKAKELEAKAREEKKAGAMSEETKKAVEELNSSRPKPPEFQKRITELLTDDQRKELDAKIAAAREKEKELKREEAKKRRGEGPDGQRNDPKDSPRDGGKPGTGEGR